MATSAQFEVSTFEYSLVFLILITANKNINIVVVLFLDNYSLTVEGYDKPANDSCILTSLFEIGVNCKSHVAPQVCVFKGIHTNLRIGEMERESVRGRGSEREEERAYYLFLL